MIELHLCIYNFIADGTECVETYYYVSGFCLESQAEKQAYVDNITSGGIYESWYYLGISEIACERMCSNRHDMFCSGLFYNR